MRARFKAWAEPYIKNHPEVVLTDSEASTLDNLYLEIGSGKGDFLVKMSQNHPELFFVGVEKNVSCSGFIAKKLVSNYPFFGSVARGLNCLFVDRENENTRKKIMDDIYNKQKNYMEGKSFAPLTISRHTIAPT